MATELYKDGNHMGIWTDAQDVETFLDDICVAWDALIDKGWCVYISGNEVSLASDWEFQFQGWLPKVIDICDMLRMQKNSLSYSIGNVDPSDLVIKVINSDKHLWECPTEVDYLRSQNLEIKNIDNVNTTEPQFPLSLVLERVKASYKKGYEEGQEDLSLVTDFKINELEKQVAFWQVRDSDGWGYWRDLAISLEKQLKDARKDINYQQSSAKAASTLLKEEEQKTKQLDKKTVEMQEDIRKLKRANQEDYKAKWLKAEAEKIEILQAGPARR